MEVATLSEMPGLACEVAQAVWECLLDRGIENQDMVLDFLKEAALCRVAHKDGDLRGFVVMDNGIGQKDAELVFLYVLPKYRGRGIGMVLLDCAMLWARHAGYRTIVVNKVHGYFRMWGYKAVDENRMVFVLGEYWESASPKPYAKETERRR